MAAAACGFCILLFGVQPPPPPPIGDDDDGDTVVTGGTALLCPCGECIEDGECWL